LLPASVGWSFDGFATLGVSLRLWAGDVVMSLRLNELFDTENGIEVRAGAGAGDGFGFWVKFFGAVVFLVFRFNESFFLISVVFPNE
jgi:hypothetical protein